MKAVLALLGGAAAVVAARHINRFPTRYAAAVHVIRGRPLIFGVKVQQPPAISLDSQEHVMLAEVEVHGGSAVRLT